MTKTNRAIWFLIGWLAAQLWAAQPVAAQSAQLHAPDPSSTPAQVWGADGERVRADLIDVDEHWRPQFRTAAGTRRWAEREWLGWGKFYDRDRATWTLLAAGSLLMGDVSAIDDTSLRLESQSFAPASLSRTNVRGIVWRVPMHAGERDKLVSRLVDEPLRQDTAWLVNGDRLMGRMNAEPEGSQPLGEVTQLRVFSAQSQAPLTVALENVVAIGLAARREDVTKRPVTGGLIGLSDGSRLFVRQISRAESGWQLDLLDGETLFAPDASFWRSVTGILRFGPDVAYLSDLPTIGFKHIPFLSQEWGFGVDRNAVGGQLRAGGCLYAKGLGMHSISRLAYDLNRSFRRFEAELAIDGAVEGDGSVVFRVLVERANNDGKTAGWKIAYESPIVRAGDAPLAIAVDVTGGLRLALVIDAAELGGEGDHGNWLNARLVE